MLRHGVFLGIYSATYLALAASSAFGQSSNLDLARVVGGTAASAGLAAVSTSDGFLYTVGITNNAASFQTTQGALRLQGSGAAVFAQKLASDGSVVASALIADAGYGNYAAKIDAGGNIYIAVATQNIAGVAAWNGGADGYTGVIKVRPQLDRILYATHVFGYYTGQMSLDVDTDGSVFAALVNYDNVKLAKLDAGGSLTFSYIFTDTPARGGGTAYDGQWVGVAVAPDHSIVVAASPMFVYRLDAAGKTQIYRASLGNESIQLSALCLDAAGNAYVSGTAANPLPVPTTPVDYTTTDPRPHTLVMKFDSAGNNVYTSALATANVTALAVDSNNLLWGAGANTGIVAFQLNSAGNAYLHYLTIPSDSSGVGGLSIDSSGRPLLAGATASFQLPDSKPPRNGNHSDRSAFFIRVKANPAQTNLKLTLTSLEAAASTFGDLTYQATISNAGQVAANDVRIVVPGFVTNTQPDISSLLYYCHATGNGACISSGGTWSIYYSSLAPGESETVQFLVTIPSPAPSPFPLFLSAATSADDPDQSNNNAYTETPIQTQYLNIQTSLPYLTLDVDTPTQVWSIGSFTNRGFSNPGVPAVPGSTVNVFVPSPQVVFGVPYAFLGWSDGSTDNPRRFTASSNTPAVNVLMRTITEPWVNPDAPVQHAGSYRNGAIAPGEIVTLFGYNLGPAKLQGAALDDAGRIATKVAGFQVFFDGVAAPIVYTSAIQSSVIVPYEVTGKPTVQMTMQFGGLNSAPVTVPVTDSVPGLLTANSSGSGQLAAFNSDGSLNGRGAPASRGDLVVLYETGEGLTDPLPADGSIGGSALPTPRLPVSVTIGGVPAEIAYFGGVSGVTAGLMQLNVRVPANAPTGLLPVLLTVGANTSQREATIAVR